MLQKILQTDQLERTHWVFIVMTICMMLPFPFAVIGMPIALVYLLKQHPITTVIHRTTSHVMIHLFLGISLLSSLVAGNTVGICATLALTVFYIYCCYYKTYVNRQTFELSLDIMLLISILHAGYATLQGWFIAPPIDYNALHPSLITWHDGRADSFFFNPNYYALACAFFILISGYKMYRNQTSRYFLLYASIALINGIGMMFTLTRTILPSLLIALITFGFLIKSRRFKKLLAIVTVVILIAAVFFYRDIPRFELNAMDEHIMIRVDIWTSSLAEIAKTPLIGKGPLSYMLIYPFYQSPATQHAHNMIIDTWLNYGIFGLIFLGWCLYRAYKHFVLYKTSDKLRHQYALAASFVVLILVHGIMDMAIFWLQTLFIFMSVLLVLPNLYQSNK